MTATEALNPGKVGSPSPGTATPWGLEFAFVVQRTRREAEVKVRLTGWEDFCFNYNHQGLQGQRC